MSNLEIEMLYASEKLCVGAKVLIFGYTVEIVSIYRDYKNELVIRYKDEHDCALKSYAKRIEEVL
ncbi:MAG TPA: hypothetical protein VK190_03465 [Pseudoneobacillus sp.]|nr:hypothetical protein [Pseudoneobacillus sp.]